MGEDPRVAESRRRGIDPRNFDPRRALDPAAMERVARAQAVARAEAQAATTVVIATVVSLVTSAFGFVAALAWNTAIQALLNDVIATKFGLKPNSTTLLVIYAVVATLIAIVVVVITNRFASGIAKKSAINATLAEMAQ
jgi:ABC-type uncharacterized transport system fused permease/ATPase subunit